MEYMFPFGEKVKRVEQKDKNTKKVFVLGVYASAVHAKWIKDDKIVCRALAVASEPCIFWNGNRNEAQEIISKITIPPEVGCLILPKDTFNGPSGRVLEEKILSPLNVTRANTWLCDLLPETRINKQQQSALSKHYEPIVERYKLNKVTIPLVQERFCDEERREQITDEILVAKPEILVLLGDQPIKQYLKFVSPINFRGLKDYQTQYGYGKPISITIKGFNTKVVPIAHPTHIGKFRSFSDKCYYDEHTKWESEIAPFLLKSN